MPGKGILATSDITGAALKTTLIVHHDLTAFVELVEVGRTNVQTVTDCAAALANLLVDKYVGLLAIDLENVQPQFSFDIQLRTSLAVFYYKKTLGNYRSQTSRRLAVGFAS
jgi:hypothetical protein